MPDFVYEVWHGQRTLNETFWVWHVRFANIFCWYIGGYFALNLSISTFRPIYGYLFICISIPISIWAWVGIWRSSRKASGDGPVLAKVAVVMSVVATLWQPLLGWGAFYYSSAGPLSMQERHVYDLLQEAVDDGQREIRLGEVLNFPWDRACFLPDLIYHHDEELLTGRKRSDFPDWHSGPSDKFYALIIIENDGPAFRVRLQDREFL